MRQLTMDLWKRDRCLEALAAECDERGLLASDVALLVAIAREDQTREAESLCCKSKRDWKKATGHDGNTAVAAMRRLKDLGVAAWEVDRDGYSVLVDWQAVFALPETGRRKAERRTRLRGAITASGEEVVRGGEAAPTCSSNKNIKLVSTVSPVSNVVQPHQVNPSRPAAWWARPWAKRGGMPAETLVEAVRDRDEAILTRLYFAGVEASYWEETQRNRVRFLACCWQSVQSSNGSAMGLLQNLVRIHLGGKPRPAALKGDGLSDDADDWAAQTRAGWHRRRVEREWAAGNGDEDSCDREQELCAVDTRR